MSSCDDAMLDYLSKLADKVLAMCSSERVRVQKISRDTSFCFYHTCHGLVSITKFLLQTSHDFVLLGDFSMDPLEKAFCKLRQGCGGTYFITAQQVLEKHPINKVKLILRQNVPLSSLDDNSGAHKCTMCTYRLSPCDTEFFDALPQKESSVPLEDMESLVYISGYTLFVKIWTLALIQVTYIMKHLAPTNRKLIVEG